MTDNPHPTSPGHWLRLKAACKHLNISTVTLTKKLNAGTGPRSYQSPGSRFRIFWSGDLDAWILNAPPHPVTPAERERLAKLQAGAERVRQERRERRATKIEGSVTA
jgi:hypothetical protein